MRVLALLPVVAAAGLAACGDPFSILPASIPNVVDTVTVFAVNGTGLTQPSAYVLPARSRIRLGIDNVGYNFDFLYRIDPANGPEFVPFRAVTRPGSTDSPTGYAGFLLTQTPFDAIDEGEQLGYVVDQPVPLAVGTTLYVRSGLPNGCFLQIPYYAKLEVLSFDSAARSVTFQILVDINCGYRGLEPGIPER